MNNIDNSLLMLKEGGIRMWLLIVSVLAIVITISLGAVASAIIWKSKMRR
ncbi:hypothetical protein [Niallia circulans]|nr:hypothetical protein [Niallia circulans]MCF2649697.1 hypothetical protein [Niallia circulans]